MATNKDKTFHLEPDFYRKIVDSLEDYAVFTIDLNGKIRSWSVGAEKILGYKEREVIGKSYTMFFTAEDIHNAIPGRELKKAIQGKRELTEGWRIRKGKKRLWATGFVAPFRNRNGKIIGFTKIMRDRTERKKLEDARHQLLVTEQQARHSAEKAEIEQMLGRQELERHKERLSIAQRAGKIGSYEWLIKENKIIASPELEALYGLIPGTFDGTYEMWMAAVHPDDRDYVDTHLKNAISRKIPYSAEFRVKWPNNSIHWLLGKGDAFFDKKGKAVRMIGVNIDITDRKRIEEALKESERHHASVVAALAEGILIRDMDGVIRMANPSAMRILGLGQEDIIGKRSEELALVSIHEDGTEFLPEEHPALRALKNGRAHFNEIMGLKRPNGEIVWILINAIPLSREGHEEPYAIVSSFVDITMRKNLEQQKDTFIGIASHELKTPITSMKLFADILYEQAKQENNKGMIESSQMIQSQSDRLLKLIGDLLDVSRIQAGKLSLNVHQFDLDELIKEIVTDIQFTTRSHKIIYSSKPGKFVFADRDRIGQVLTNFLTNAIKYSPRANNIIVRTRKTSEALVVQVQDFGPGIPKEEQDKIFDRFFRTEYAREKNISGFGLGLYISSEIVRRHKGTLTVKSTVGQGSVFSFSLPLTPQQGLVNIS
jgi:PAS domain S-box-containing protein